MALAMAAILAAGPALALDAPLIRFFCGPESVLITGETVCEISGTTYIVAILNSEIGRANV